jgi:predicted glycoside hydrolase/deacetylase ChbG (UPF0249 family)
MTQRSQSLAQLLGYPSDARLLIVNADDFGMCQAENAATIEGLRARAYNCATIMVPCPWFVDAAAQARTLAADIGVHLTHTSEWATYRWGSVSGAGTVPSLLDADGYLHGNVPAVYAHAVLADIERECRAQIARALAAGIDVTHLDSHQGVLQLDARYHEVYVRLAAEHRLPIRMASRSFMRDIGMEHIVELADGLGVLSPDHLWFGSPEHPGDTARFWNALFEQLHPGVNEVLVHAGFDTPEGQAITPEWAQRVADHRFFTAPATRARLAALGIVQIGYREVRDLQRRLLSC